MCGNLNHFFKTILALSVALMVLTGLASIAARAETGTNATFTATYASTQTKSAANDKSQALNTQADAASKAGRSVESCAKYLAAAASAYADGNFERARPYFDKAFLLAERMSVADQKEMLVTISRIVSDARDSAGDYDVYKYFAQNRLRLLRKQKGSTPTERYNEVQTIAFSCSQNHRFKEAQSLLLETLADLQASDPQSESIGWCFDTLARVSEDSGDFAAARKYYDREIAFTKVLPGKRNYQRALENYTHFLINKKMFKELVPVAGAFYDEIERTGEKDRISHETIARALAEINVDLSSKFYRLAFEQEKHETQSAMNMPYGNTACAWATMLHKYGKNAEAIAVLKEGMTFCRTAKWPDAMERNMPQMVALCKQLMIGSNYAGDATALQNSVDSEMKSRKERQQRELESKLDSDINTSGIKPLTKVKALTEKAYRAFDASNCQQGVDLIVRAVQVYEANAQSPDSAQMYNYFYNLDRRFQTCRTADACRPLLMRIVKARMISGFEDPAAGPWHSNCGGTRWAFDDLCGYFGNQLPGVIDDLLTYARASKKKSNIIYVLDHMLQGRVDDKRIAILEEMETLRSENANKSLLFGSMLRTADTYAYLKHWDKAMSKCKAALAVAQSAAEGGTRNAFPASGSFYNIGRSFEAGGQLTDAAELYCMAYKQSLNGDSDAIIQMNLRSIDGLIKTYEGKHDISAGAQLLTNLSEISKAKLGPYNTFTRSWLMKLSTFYLNAGDQVKGKHVYSELADSLFKPGMSMSKANEESLVEYSRTLKETGCKIEAAKVDEKLKELELKHCGVQ